jgi:hypothetical protein
MTDNDKSYVAVPVHVTRMSLVDFTNATRPEVGWSMMVF